MSRVGVNYSKKNNRYCFRKRNDAYFFTMSKKEGDH